MKHYDILVIGGGIVGTATAMQILRQKPQLKLLLIEEENSLAPHQTGNNSGVIHSGLYYKPGSLKAQNCVKGRKLMYQFCEENGIKYERCGKLVLAANENEREKLNELEKRGRENGLTQLKRVSKEEIKEFEPYASGIDALFVGETGIVNYTEVTEAFARKIKELNGEILLNTKFLACLTDRQGIKKEGNRLIVETSKEVFAVSYLVNCGGLYSDKIAEICGVDPRVQIIPFRGEYYEIKEEKKYLVKNLIYPVPDPRFPFLGVHFTRMINGGIEAGPNAVLAFKRKGYLKTDFSLPEISDYFFSREFWIMARKYYRMGFDEFRRSFSKKLFTEALQKLVPQIQEEDIEPSGSGVRAQALDRNGNLLDDFCLVEAERMMHVLNAPSPAATASISIGETIAEKVIHNLV
ncbi:MAG: L-2-hydroxyglutarate oxidase [Ignavibacteriaceae bacterium]|nr:L-2-hydroxyglutarate oxidase [Ignavibacteriaceae bacterium]